MALNPNVVIVAPGDLITSVHLNNIRSNLDRLDTSKLSLSGGTVTGNLAVQATVTANAVRVVRSGSPRPFIEFYDPANTTKQGSVVGADTGLELVSDVGAVKFFAVAAQVGSIDGGNLLLGKSAPNLQAVGFELLHTTGSARSTMNAASSPNYYANHIGAADAAGTLYAQYTRGATVIGSVTQVATTGVAYNTTSDERLKTVVAPADPAAAVAKVAAMNPVRFTWNDDPAAGEQVGFIAQQLVTVAPEAVTEGTGVPGDAPDPQTGDGGFVPWMTDLSKLVPTLVAAVQALTVRLEALEAV